MAIALPTGYIRTTVEPLDALYLDISNPIALVPYPNVGVANTAIGPFQRYLGLFVNISNGSGGSVLYWYKDGITDPDLVPFSAGGGGSTFTPPLPATTAPNTGGYINGTQLSGTYTMQQMWTGLLYPYVAPSTNGAISPTSNLFNQTNITISAAAPSIYNPGGPDVFFTWQKNAGSVDLVSADIEFRRGSGPWTSVGTTITSPATYLNEPKVDIDLSAPFIINPSIDNSTLQMRCAFVDQNNISFIYFSPTLSSTFALYAAPSITNLFNDPTPTFAPGTYKLLKNFTAYSNTYISGTINRNTPLVNITGYDIEYSSNGSSWTTIPGGPYPGSNTATISVALTESAISLAGTTGYFTRIKTADTQFPTLTVIQNSTVNIGDYTIYNPVFAGMIDNATYIGPVSAWIPNIYNNVPYVSQALLPNGPNNNGGQCNYTNTIADITLTNLNFISVGGDRMIIAYPASYGPLNWFGNSGNNFLQGGANFTLTTQAVTTLTGGGSVTYNIYVQNNPNSPAALGPYYMNP